jgi:succinate dehydrogenase / fumarate reductase flavoprotein subunit
MPTRVEYHQLDAVVVGGGGSGLAAAVYLARQRNVRTGVISKLYPTRSHTGTAQGGIGAALGNEDPEGDSWEWHMFDTVKGSDYLADQDAVEIMCKDAVEVVYELEHMGLPFSRTSEGRIAQRRFGGHAKNFGEAPVRRSCYAADRTGHMILQTLYQQCIKHSVEFYDEFHVIDLLVEKNRCQGVVAIEIHTGALHFFHAKAVLFATGGWGRMYQITSNAVTLTGDAPALVWRCGLPLEDMEFFQFHPTGIYKLGILITEGVRGEGGVLRNREGERFMERYAPTMKDLASRDVVSRAIYREIAEGRGVDGKRFVHLDATHLGRELIEKRLPDIADFCRTYIGIDPAVEPIPVQPTAHYAMGGVPTDSEGRVLADADGTVVEGLYASGECACVSVHGANRLGTNSLLDIVVFGRRAGRHMGAYAADADFAPRPSDPGGRAIEMIERIRAGKGERPAMIRDEMQEVMTDHVSVFREPAGLDSAVEKLRELRERYQQAQIDDTGQRFNLDLLEAFELGCLLDCAYATAVSARNRTESRGAHYREDYPDRNDEEWLKHTFVRLGPKDSVEFSYRPVTITRFQPKVRVY